MQSNQTAYQKTMTSQEIYHALREDILDLKLRPGQMISENETAKRYNVSRTPVKAAFTRLEGEGFVEVLPQKGTFVTLIDCKHVRDILYMRYVLEVDILKFIRNGYRFDETVEKLEENLNAQEALIEQGDVSPESYNKLDLQFHEILFDQADRSGVWSIIQANQVHYPRFRLLDTYLFGRYEELRRQHAEILNALKHGDTEQLDQSVYNHLHQYLVLLSKLPSNEYRELLINW